MALASGTPVDTASGAIRVGSSPTLINISFCLDYVDRLGDDVVAFSELGRSLAWKSAVSLFFRYDVDLEDEVLASLGKGRGLSVEEREFRRLA